MSGRVRTVLAATARGAGCTVVAVALAAVLWRERSALGDQMRALGPGYVLLAGALVVAGLVPGMLGWRALLEGMGARLELRDAIRLYFVGGLAKYIPGGLWPALAHAGLAQSVRQPPARLAGGFLGSVVLSTAAGAAVGVLAVPVLAGPQPLWWLLAPVALALPAVVVWAAPVLGARRQAAVDRRTALYATALMGAGWVLAGLHVSVLATALGADPGRALAVGVGGFALSAVCGMLAFVLPAGLGARDVVLGLTLAAVLSGPAVVAAVALSRVLVTLGDVSTGLAAMAVHRAGARKARLDAGTN